MEPSLAASAFSPDFVIISAGFDAARGDPLGCCDVSIIFEGRNLQLLESVYCFVDFTKECSVLLFLLSGDSGWLFSNDTDVG